MKIIGIIITLGILYALNNAGVIRISFEVDRIQQIVQAFGAWGILVYILIGALRPFFFVPSIALFISGGIIFGTIQGSIYNLIGLMSAVSLSFLVASKFQGPFRNFVGEKYLKKLEKIEGDQVVKSFFIMRVTPAFPIDLVSFGAGLVNVDFRKFFIGTLLGMAPKSTLYTFLGDQIDNLYSIKTLVGFGILILLAVISYFFDEIFRNSSRIEED